MGDREERFLDLLEEDQNSAQVQYELGMCYLQGDGVAQDGAEAEKWLRRAAEQGHEEAQAVLAAASQKEEQAHQEAVVTEAQLPEWCMRAENGDAEAQYQVAMYFLNSGSQAGGSDVERYLNQAAEQGHPQACLQLGMQLLERAPQKAVRHLKNAADCGVSQAAYQLALCLSQGIGVEKDPEQAERRFIQAAEWGGSQEKLELAVRYAVGDDLPLSWGKALSWVKRAQDGGMDDAKERFQEWSSRRKEEKDREAAEEAARQAELARKRAEEAERQRIQAEKKRAEDEARRKAAEEARKKAAAELAERRRVAAERRAQEQARQREEAQRQQAAQQAAQKATQEAAQEAARQREAKQAQSNNTIRFWVAVVVFYTIWNWIASVTNVLAGYQTSVIGRMCGQGVALAAAIILMHLLVSWAAKQHFPLTAEMLDLSNKGLIYRVLSAIWLVVQVYLLSFSPIRLLAAIGSWVLGNFLAKLVGAMLNKRNQ